MASAPDPHASSELPHWETISVSEVADCRVFRVVRKTCRHPVRDKTHDFYVLDGPDWVNVVATTADGSVVMVRQYRYGIEGLSLEVPGGVMEKGEEPIQAARRELEEETGYVGGEARLLGRVHPNPAIQNNTCHLVCIEGVHRGAEQAWDEHEEIEVELLSQDQVFAMVRAGAITHALAFNALTLFELESRSGGPRV